MNPPLAKPVLTRRQIVQILLAAAVGLGLFFLARQLPTGTNLPRFYAPVNPNASSLQFCEACSPLFLPVSSVPSPVIMTLHGDRAPARGQPVNFTFNFRTTSGLALGPKELLETHTKLIHLMVIDPSLRDYQHIHPEPGAEPGEWHFSMTPHRAGKYIVFADFMPALTGLELYSSASFTVPGEPDAPMTGGGLAVARDGYNFRLRFAKQPLRAGQLSDLYFTIERADGGEVPLGIVMGTYAHLALFDLKRTGFAHLHPTILDPHWRPDPRRPKLDFQVQLDEPGRYVIWAEVNLGGRLEFVPFEFTVVK